MMFKISVIVKMQLKLQLEYSITFFCCWHNCYIQTSNLRYFFKMKLSFGTRCLVSRVHTMNGCATHKGRSLFTWFCFNATWHGRYTINFRFNAIWHGRNVAALLLCWRLEESDITVMPSVTRMDWSWWWYKHVKAIPLQAWTGPEGSRRLRLPDFKTVGTWRWLRLSAQAMTTFTPRKYSWYSFLLEAESTPGT